MEVFVSMSCDIHARYAMMNEFYNRWKDIPDSDLKDICIKVIKETFL